MQATILLTVLSLGAPGLKVPMKGTLDILGEWTVESEIVNGEAVQPVTQTSFSFAETGKWSRSINGKVARNCDTFLLDAASSPATIDLFFTKETSMRGFSAIIKVEGDTLSLCYNHRSFAPLKFESKADSDHHIAGDEADAQEITCKSANGESINK